MTIQTQIERISTANQNIKASIVDSGVAVPEGTKIDGLAPLVGGIVGQFSDDLDLIIGADTTPIPDAIALADKINGEDVSGGSEPTIELVTGTLTASSKQEITLSIFGTNGTSYVSETVNSYGEYKKTVNILKNSVACFDQSGSIEISGGIEELQYSEGYLITGDFSVNRTF